MKYFADNDNTFSWRKAGTAICFGLFAYTVIGHQIVHKFAELPSSYQAIISGVFIFYFFKDTIRNVKIGNSNNTN